MHPGQAVRGLATQAACLDVLSAHVLQVARSVHLEVAADGHPQVASPPAAPVLQDEACDGAPLAHARACACSPVEAAVRLAWGPRRARPGAASVQGRSVTSGRPCMPRSFHTTLLHAHRLEPCQAHTGALHVATQTEARSLPAGAASPALPHRTRLPRGRRSRQMQAQALAFCWRGPMAPACLRRGTPGLREGAGPAHRRPGRTPRGRRPPAGARDTGRRTRWPPAAGRSGRPGRPGRPGAACS